MFVFQIPDSKAGYTQIPYIEGVIGAMVFIFALSVSAVIRMALQNGEATVELFQQDDAGELMRQRDLAEGENGLGLRPGRVAPAISGPDGEQQLLRTVRLVVLQEVGDLFRGELFAARVEQYQLGLGTAF